MTITAENILLVGSILLFISIFATRAGHRFGVPTLLLFLLVGMFAGSDGLGIEFSNPKMAQFIGMIALSIILFSGGMDTKKEEIRPIAMQGLVLATFGVLLTALLTAGFIYWLTHFLPPEFQFSFLESFLLASVMSSTDSASVFSILRQGRQNLKQQLRPLLELESGSNDPMAYMLTIVLIQAITTVQADPWQMVGIFFYQMMVGTICGYTLGKLCNYFLKRAKMLNDALFPILILAFAFFIFAFTDAIKANGYLAIYIGGLVIGNAQTNLKRNVKNFFDGLAWLSQIIMFLTLGLLINPRELLPVIVVGLVIGAFMIFVSRPAAVLVCLAPFRKMTMQARLFVSWVGLRGAVPIIFATYPLIAGIPQAQNIFNIVFFITIISLLLQGTTIPAVARFLHLSEKEDIIKGSSSFDVDFSDEISSSITEVEITKESLRNGNTLAALGLPDNSLVIMVKRKQRFFVPRGNTIIQPKDKLLLIADDDEALSLAREKFNTSAH